MSDDDVARMQADGGVAGFVDIVARLLTATFSGSDGDAKSGTPPVAGGGDGATRPFPGTT